MPTTAVAAATPLPVKTPRVGRSRTPPTAPSTPAVPAAKPLRALVDRISAWYQEQLGEPLTEHGNSRVVSIMLYLEEQSLELADCALKVTTDPLWNQRNKRGANERAAQLVGHTQARGQSGRHIFIYPATASTAVAE